MTIQLTNILFMQSQPWFHADSQIHASLMQRLDRTRFGVHVACVPDSPAYESLRKLPDVTLRATNFGPSLNKTGGAGASLWQSLALPAELMRLLAYVRRNHIQIIHCSEKPRDAFYGYWLAKLSGAKCLIHLHVKVEDWISSLTQWVMHRADSLVGVSEFVAQSSMAEGFPAQTTTFIHNGLALDDWQEVNSAETIRPEFDLTDSDILMAAIARIATYKGQADLLRALALVKRENPHFKLLIVGSEDPYAGNLEELKQLTAEFELDDQVVFTGFRTDVAQIFAACDIFTLPSFEEPFGMVFVEAMMMQKPVAAIESGGVAEIVSHGQTGLLSPPRDARALADNILQLMADAPLRKRMGRLGRERVMRHFSADAMTRRFETHYAQLVADKTPLAVKPTL